MPLRLINTKTWRRWGADCRASIRTPWPRSARLPGRKRTRESGAEGDWLVPLRGLAGGGCFAWPPGVGSLPAGINLAVLRGTNSCGLPGQAARPDSSQTSSSDNHGRRLSGLAPCCPCEAGPVGAATSCSGTAPAGNRDGGNVPDMISRAAPEPPADTAFFSQAPCRS